MLDCPRCRQPIDSRVITCPHCGCILKAHGHPGIPLHRVDGDDYLCQSCIYDADDSCTFPQRPFAKECTLYRQHTLGTNRGESKLSKSSFIRHWLERHLVWVVLLALIVISLLLAWSP